MKKITVVSFIILTIMLGCNKPQISDIGIIPKPNSLIVQKGHFEVNGNLFVKAASGLAYETNYLNSFLSKIEGLKLLTSEDGSKKIIQLNIDSALAAEEYSLIIEKKIISITGGSNAGIFYGIQSLLQLFPASIYNKETKAEKIELPCIEIKDKPRFKYRGMHLDVSRHFFDKTEILRFIDLLSMHKLNVFHWHLTDDNGWRIEIKKYPKLTSLGAWRVDTRDQPWNYFSEISNDSTKKLYGGYYTQEDIKEIVAYAGEKHISIIPEIEMPGHSMAVMAAYPELSCSEKAYSKPNGVVFEFTAPFCAGNEKVFVFLEDVLTEVMALFPGKYIHVGGDEARKTPWEKCPKCQKRMKAENLHDVEELQSYFITRMEKFISSKGRVLIGWDEILEGGLAPGATVMSWRGEKGGIEAAKMGHDVIMTPSNVTYFDGMQYAASIEGQTQPMLNNLERVYSYNPIPKELNEQEAKFVMGVQACLWTEYVQDEATVQSRVLPRMSALSEIAWTELENKNDTDFFARLEKQFNRYTEAGYNYFLLPPVGMDKEVVIIDSVEVKLTKPYSFGTMRYTTDGTEPNESSTEYTKSFVVKEDMVLQYAFFIGERSSIVEKSYIKIKPFVNSVKSNISGKGISYQVYSETVNSLNEAFKTKEIESGVLDSINLPVKRPADHFSIQYSGYLKIDIDDVYIITLNSDDGSRLYLHNEIIIDNDGIHAPITKSAQIPLKKGYHPFRLEYFEGNFGEILEMNIVGRKGGKVEY